VTSAYRMVSYGAGPAGAVLSGLLTHVYGLRGTARAVARGGRDLGGDDRTDGARRPAFTEPPRTRHRAVIPTDEDGAMLMLGVLGHLATLVPVAAAAASGWPSWSGTALWCFVAGQVIVLAGCVAGWVRTRDREALIGWACGLFVVPVAGAVIMLLAFVAYGGN
jgi:hypothetical protein